MDKQEFLNRAAIAAMQGIVSAPEHDPRRDEPAPVAEWSWGYALALWEQRPEEAK